MAIDTPARIAVLGAGPVGLEAALYARYLGYEVDVYERGGIGANLLDWGHVRMFTPFAANRTTLGLAAILAQDPAWRPPADDDLLKAHEYVAEYLLPLAQSDLLSDSIHPHTQAIAVGRDESLKGDLVGDARRGEEMFHILLVHDRQERIASADVVIDTTGTFGNHNWLGQGGIPAIGERESAQHIEYGLPDVLGSQRPRYADRRVLLVGCGYSAATSIVDLAILAQQAPRTRIHWVTRRASGDLPGPVAWFPDDRLAERDRLARAANALAGAGAPVTHHGGANVTRVQWHPDSQTFSVDLSSAAQLATLEVDQLIANVGYRPDNSLTAELQVHHCYATDGPMTLAASLAGHASADCLDQPPRQPSLLVTSEPNFYILGAKSYGRRSNFLLATGFDQVRQVFSIIADRADLDLYATARGAPA